MKMRKGADSAPFSFGLNSVAMRLHKQYSGLFLCICTISSAVWADTGIDKDYLEIGIFSQYFDYRELDTSHDRLLKEYGRLPGFHVSLGQSHSNFSTKFTVALSQGSVIYDGQTQGSVPLDTTTEEQITQIEFSVRPNSKPIDNVAVLFDMGFGYRTWVRDIQPTATTNGLYEVYQWAYSKLALGFHWRLSPRMSVGVAGEALHPINPTIDVNVVGYDRVSLNMNGQDTFRLSLPVHIRYTNNVLWIFEPFWQMWEMGRGDTKPLYVGGVPTAYSATEPDNTVRMIGVSVSMRFTQ